MKKSISDTPFASRMAGKPLPESLNADPSARFFYDPPELIQQAFGGRFWFFDRGCTRVHRVGLFKGLGWEIDTQYRARGITGIRITARPVRPGKPVLFDLEFMGRRIDDDEQGYFEALTVSTIDHRPGLELHQLKPAYAEVLGETAI